MIPLPIYSSASTISPKLLFRCKVLLHNPSVTASPCHLPLHKGGLGDDIIVNFFHPPCLKQYSVLN